jgi:hypothetical protein
MMKFRVRALVRQHGALGVYTDATRYVYAEDIQAAKEQAWYEFDLDGYELLHWTIKPVTGA